MPSNTNENTTGGFGKLRVSAFINSIGRPAPGAVIRVIDPTTNKVIEETKTDESGQIPPITLVTPPLEYSMNSNFPRPFNQYNVTAKLPDYNEVTIENVQVYPSTTALQNAILIPTYTLIDIPYPVLWGDYPPKIPEAEVKEMPLPSGYVVLPKPVVPEIIVVHAGKPNDSSAPNYSVGFKDYVKNVACSEIYSTWPKETIKANVLAMISFTLNRVYTEWYRGKGYDFTITNSTAYDQAFSFGRNIFQEVSDIVDDVFNTYISRPDIIQPLFTQYSDGKKIKREGWLSQWGSKTLGDQGLSALQILKRYYGSDIILKQAERVEGAPLSFPGKPLKIGSAGEAVEVVQEQLNAVAKNYPLIPKLVVDGVYGPKTAQSVKTFQEIFKLPATGEVNFPTWYKLSDVYVAVEKLS